MILQNPADLLFNRNASLKSSLKIKLFSFSFFFLNFAEFAVLSFHEVLSTSKAVCLGAPQPWSWLITGGGGEEGKSAVRCALALRAPVSLSRPLPEEWVIICPHTGQNSRLLARREQHFPSAESSGSALVVIRPEMSQQRKQNEQAFDCELLLFILMTSTDRAAEFLRGKIGH